MPDWIERTDEGLVGQSMAFSQHLSADPGAYGVPPERAAELALKQQDFTLKLRLAQQPTGNSTVALKAKQFARESLVRDMRALAKAVRAFGVSPEQLVQFGLKPAAPRRRVVSGPAAAPQVNIVSVERRTVTVQLRDPQRPGRKARPRDVSCAAVFGFVGDQPPAGTSAAAAAGQGWKPFGNRTRTTFTLDFNGREIPSGATVWITAAWLGTRQQPGPAATPASTQVYGPPMFKLNVLRAA